jgi:hypothetical protein
MYHKVETTYFKGRTQYKVAKRAPSLKVLFPADIGKFEQLIKLVVRQKAPNVK